jgi:hypothetical protein
MGGAYGIIPTNSGSKFMTNGMLPPDFKLYKSSGFKIGYHSDWTFQENVTLKP